VSIVTYFISFKIIELIRSPMRRWVKDNKVRPKYNQFRLSMSDFISLSIDESWIVISIREHTRATIR